MDSGHPEGDLVVTLFAQGGGQVLDRCLVLNRDRKVVPVGRSSKALVKQIVATKDNAWFDSPVMSRNHAEFVADMEAKTVSIRDVGSMHGTFLNGKIIPMGTLYPVGAGDTVRFGVSIARQNDAFPPTIVKVGIDFLEPCRPARFTVPDSPLSEAEAEAEAELAKAGDESDPKHNPATLPIDLTLDAQPSNHLLIDLTSSPSPSRSGSLHPQGHVAIQAIESCHISDNRGQLDQVDSALRTLFSMASSGMENDAESSICLSEPDLGDDESNGKDSEGDNDSPSMDAYSSSDDDSDSVLDMELDSCGSNRSNGGLSGEEHEDLFVWDDADSDDDYSGTSDNEGVGADNPPMPSALPPIEMVFEKTRLVTDAGSSMDPALVTPKSLNIATSSKAADASSSAEREPSPSDAAMPKSIKTTPLVSQHPTSTILCEEFLAARRENMANVAARNGNGGIDVTTASNIVNGGISSSVCPSTEPSSVPQPAPADAEPLLSSQPPLEPSPLLLSGQRFLNSPPSGDYAAAASVENCEEDDLTSAFAFHCKRIASNPPAAEPRRTHLGINDILDHNQLAAPSAKRKADDIADVTDEDQTWAAKEAAEGGSINPAPAVSTIAATSEPTTGPSVKPFVEAIPRVPPPSCSGQASASCNSAADYARPSKRLRSVAKEAGKLTLTAITVGAMVFGSMVYMAPNF